MKHFSELKKFNILIVGDLMLDSYLYGTIQRISPEAPVPVLEKIKIENKPGGAANVALNVKSLGCDSILLGIVGDDNSGKILIELLNENKIETENIITVKNRPTTVKTRILSGSHHILRIDEEEISDLVDADLHKLMNSFDAIIEKKSIDAVIIQDYNKGLLNQELIIHIITECNKKNIFISVDPKNKNFNCYSGVKFFKPNLKEISEILNEKIYADINSLVQAANKLQEIMKYENLFITLGDKGIFFKNNEKTGIIPTKKKNVIDVSGAGDVVISAATIFFLHELQIEKIAELSNVAGGLACDYLGVATITKSQLLEAITE
jgi:D-glycero-beta-D-manno-heptose-7-phosphate kinase